MKYYSLNHNSKPTLFQDAVKRGLAPDRGLYFPETITKLPNTFFEEIEDMSITEMAYKVIKPYIGNQIKKEKLLICKNLVIRKRKAFDLKRKAFDL